AHVREDLVGRRRADEDEVDVLRTDAGRLHRVAGGAFAQRERGLALARDVALRDARPLADPLVAGLDRFRELVVRDDALGQTTAGAGDARMLHCSCSSSSASIRFGTAFSTSSTAMRIACFSAT